MSLKKYLTRLLPRRFPGRLFPADCRGSVAIYVAMFTAIGIGGGALAIDYGRVALLKSQLQSAADAAALAAVTHLDGNVQSRSRSESVARSAARNRSVLPSGAGVTDLVIDQVTFYSEFSSSPVAATSDLDAKFVEVTMSAQTVKYMFAPVLNMFGGTPHSGQQLHARSVAGSRPFICHAPPLMICDLGEGNPADDPTLATNIGKQIRLTEPQGGSGTWAPGNFGLLSLPDGSSGASAIKTALAAIQPQDCYQLDVVTATGTMTNPVKDGINVRFDISPIFTPPAPNVINFPKDSTLIADETARLGNGVWDLDGYWGDKHGGTPPVALTGATRYQVYLYELGEQYAANGKQTLHPVPQGSLPVGFALITPPTVDIPINAANPTLPDFDGVPQNTPASNGPARRLMGVAILQCVADNIQGHGTYPTNGKFVELFITEEVRDPPDAGIYGEIIRSLSPNNDPEFHANAGLVE